MSKEVIEARADVNEFPTIGEAINEALLRADDCDVFIHTADASEEHNLEDGENCFCQPAKLESRRLR